MAQNYFGSIDFDELMTALKKGDLKTFVTDKGKRLINVNVWVNDEPNEFGYIASISVPMKEEKHYTNEKGKEIKSLYIANLKKSIPKITEGSAEDFQEEDDDLPF